MRKIFFSLLMSLSLVACGTKKNDPTPTQGNSNNSSTGTVSGSAGNQSGSTDNGSGSPIVPANSAPNFSIMNGGNIPAGDGVAFAGGAQNVKYGVGGIYHSYYDLIGAPLGGYTACLQDVIRFSNLKSASGSEIMATCLPVGSGEINGQPNVQYVVGLTIALKASHERFFQQVKLPPSGGSNSVLNAGGDDCLNRQGRALSLGHQIGLPAEVETPGVTLVYGCALGEDGKAQFVVTVTKS